MIHSAMWRYVAMQNLASLVLDDEKAIQYSECHRRHGEEIESSDYVAVIGEKGEPLLPGIPAPNHTTQISGHRALREGKVGIPAKEITYSDPKSIKIGVREAGLLHIDRLIDMSQR